MKENWKNFIKLLAILAGMVFLFWLWLNRMEPVKEEPEGEKIRTEDVQILMEALDVPITIEEEESGEDKLQELTYGQYKTIYEQIGGADKEIPDFAEKYEDDHAF